MTPDQIKAAAIEAAASVILQWFNGATDEMKCAQEVIDAYEKAMWRPRRELPVGVNVLTEAVNGHVTTYHAAMGGLIEMVPTRRPLDDGRFRPLPNPPAQQVK